eukprot:TRINITY_DN6369_c0_g1_i1.p2 TRINITY_DN6369_c0_g1~~TRINITY_DN6369_c0_g1_i1.p2  ORF type:complete len:209 (+),score=87.01 TRINITY_DN6369_c0_g1_i1:55-627(+)
MPGLLREGWRGEDSHSIKAIAQLSKQRPRTLVVVVCGVEWMPASESSLAAAQELRDEWLASDAGDVPVHFVLADQQEDRRWWHRCSILIGTPAVTFFVAGSQLKIRQADHVRSDVVVGAFSKPLLKAFVLAGIETVRAGDGRAVHLPSFDPVACLPVSKQQQHQEEEEEQQQQQQQRRARSPHPSEGPGQ